MPDSTVSLSRALRRLLTFARPLEAVPVEPHQSVGMTASHNILAHCDVPEHPSSVRDGYAMRTADIENATTMEPVRLTVTQTVRAESTHPEPVKSGTAARVLTGGLVPPGADVVLAEEDVTELPADQQDGSKTILVQTPTRPGWYIRAAGAEIAREDIITRSGNSITPQAAAVMIRTRVNSIHVRPVPTARIIALGSELSDPTHADRHCETARFPADNLVLTKGLLEYGGARITETGVLPDIEGELATVLSSKSLPNLIITTGGTGRSERDFARSSAQDAGFSTIFERVDIRPGRNMFAASRGQTLLFGLPGPPAAVFACFHALILPILHRLRGLPDLQPITARIKEGLSVRPGPQQWIALCSLERDGTELMAMPLNSKATPPMLAVAHAHGVAILDGGQGILPGGEVEVITTLFK
ncbi:molybdopterin molybdotransferase MoeA [Pseudodesulfovibrio piezophilus]|uniref:Molybdopterin molybdenumtransferase n=1 Tax=Pseudodesulfovibrio piezophilus (strain DSM 21447 / JCM 15486 / C1TLV30) TaxID=1322246 RepID=M1WRQ3_PSEP2|nr:molybdopterin molybdotransferase MoeA [Pseudodesulfovibrio piezophilus]CCH49704.1 MoeA domain protein domain I and II [Pseudodesulfovibrio piezophilus C1TLV30]